MAGQSGTGTGSAPYNPPAELQTKIRTATNQRARMTTGFNAFIAQGRSAANEGLPAVQAWLKSYNGPSVQTTVDAIMEGSTE
jgi:hypothetical protein